MQNNKLCSTHGFKRALLGSFLLHLSLLLYVGFSPTSQSNTEARTTNLNCCMQVTILDTVHPAAQTMKESSSSSEPILPEAGSSSPASSLKIPIDQDAKIVAFDDVPLPLDAVNLGGIIEVSFDVNKHNKPQNILVIEASPVGVFEEWAVAMVQRGSYQASMRKGVYISTTFRVQFIIEAGEVQIHSR